MSKVNEQTLTYKRKYKHNPAYQMAQNGRVRNAVLQQIQKGVQDYEGLVTIVSQYSKQPKQWLKRNKHFYKFSTKNNQYELSRLGDNALKTLKKFQFQTNAINQLSESAEPLSAIELDPEESLITITGGEQHVDKAYDVFQTSYAERGTRYETDRIDGTKALIIFFPAGMEDKLEYFYYDLIDAGVPDSAITTEQYDIVEDNAEPDTSFNQFVNRQIGLK